MKLPKLFKNSSKGPLEWTIEVQADAYRTHSGVVGGKITTTAWTFVEGMNIGKSNETAPYDQSVIAAKALWTKKHDNSQYRENINDTDTVYTEPMLAHNYVKRKNSIDFNKGVYVQCKLNGCLHSDTLIALEDGSQITIEQAFNTKINKKIKCFNTRTNSIEYKSITNFFKDGVDMQMKSKPINWYEIELENGATMKITGNHRVWLRDLKCWRRVDDLQIGDKLFVH